MVWTSKFSRVQCHCTEYDGGYVLMCRELAVVRTRENAIVERGKGNSARELAVRLKAFSVTSNSLYLPGKKHLCVCWPTLLSTCS